MIAVKKVLIVDDEPISLKVLGSYLKSAGLSIEEAENGQEALEKLQTNPNNYSIVLVDRIMPYMSGMELLHQMKLSSTLHDIPVVMLTGLCEREDVIDAVRAGVFDYLIKPVEPDLLINLIERAIQYADRYAVVESEMVN